MIGAERGERGAPSTHYELNNKHKVELLAVSTKTETLWGRRKHHDQSDRRSPNLLGYNLLGYKSAQAHKLIKASGIHLVKCATIIELVEGQHPDKSSRSHK